MTRVRALVRDGRKVDCLHQGEEGMVLLESTPFYAERGGQIGDTGLIKNGDTLLAVVKDSTHPFGELNMQSVTVTKGDLKVGETVQAAVEMDRHLAIARNHTATHILHAVLGKVLGGHVRQNGSLVTDRFLRFDYTHYETPTREQLDEIEILVNEAVLADKPVTTVVTDLETAKASGAKALFEEKYGKIVRVVSVGDISSELCGGTHVSSSGTIGCLKIISEESIGAGIRRITAVTGMGTVKMLQEAVSTVDSLSSRLGVKPQLLMKKVESMESEIRDLHHQIENLSRAQLAGSIDSVIAKKNLADGVNLYLGSVEEKNMNLLRNQLCPPEASISEEDNYGVWNQVLPTATKIDAPAEMSAKEVFRLASETIAKATDKSIIIAEEPTAHLSTELALQLLQLLRDQASQGKCVLIASSNPQLKACANNVINLNQINL